MVKKNHLMYSALYVGLMLFATNYLDYQLVFVWVLLSSLAYMYLMNKD